MKKSVFTILIALFILSPLPVSAEEREPTAALLLQPLGFLQFGPIAELELRLAPSLSMSFHIRLHGLGLLSHLLVTDGTEFWGAAAGLGMRYFLYPTDAPHAWFFGGMVEVGVNGFYGDAGLATAYHGVSIFMVAAANGGYRWRFGAFILEAGIYVGVGPALSCSYWYDASPQFQYNGGLPFTFFGMGELSLGIAF
ncbi:MAG: hypothetical protein JXD23_02645 [Spirochaetales bacterium]|nr:hypothetical protein [Spirochaetales bacterium]